MSCFFTHLHNFAGNYFDSCFGELDDYDEIYSPTCALWKKNTEVVLKFMRSIHRTTNLFFPPSVSLEVIMFCFVFFFKKRGESCISRVGRSDKKEKNSSLYE